MSPPRIAYEVAGSGPPLILVHGLFGSLQIWDDVVPRLADHATVVRFDLRGHGATGGPDDEDAYTLAALADDLGRLCADLELATPVIVGHSLGGAVALRYVLDVPQAAAQLVLVDTWPWGVPPGRSKRGIRRDVRRMRRRGVLGDYDDGARGRLGDPVLGRRYRDPDFAAARRREREQVVPAAVFGISRDLLASRPLTPEIEKAALPPTRLVWGAHDEGMERGMRELARAVPAELHTMPESGHNPMLDAPAELAALLQGPP